MTKSNTDKQKIQEILERGVANIYPNKAFLEKELASGKILSLYLGIDPTGPTLHLGHAIILAKLKQFQELGHKIILLIGDFTATIGDPTDKTATRQPLTREQVLKNAKNYKKQAETFLKFTGTNKAELKYNGQWLAKMNFADVLKLSSKFTVSQLLERDMFQARIKDGKAIGVHEFMYPILQAYDSVAMNVDGELGGNDQTFNMLAGRTLVKSMQNREKFVLTMKLLTDVSGTKMGKSEGNMLSLDDSPKDMFGKVMSWTDDMIVNSFELCTTIPINNINQIAKDLKAGKNPRDYKFALAEKIVTIYYGDTTAKKTGEEFIKMFSKGGLPDDMPIVTITKKKINPIDLLVALKFVSSNNEARRLIDGGGMKINNKKILSWKEDIIIKSSDIIQAGKRKFVKIK
jgi:tyrosyl-tRNA synthetase